MDAQNLNIQSMENSREVSKENGGGQVNLPATSSLNLARSWVQEVEDHDAMMAATVPTSQQGVSGSDTV